LRDHLIAFIGQPGRRQRRHKTALAHHRVDQAIVLQFFPGFLDGDHADAQFLCHCADGWQAKITFQFAADDLSTDLVIDLLIDRVFGGVVNDNVHSVFTGLPFQN
jgi:hypothetical protein